MKKRNIKFTASYCGRNYSGFQFQPNAPTIQGELENSLYTILSERIVIIGCSRTDAGVHAKEFCFNAEIYNSIPVKGLQKAMNYILPDDIAINSCEEAEETFHARYDAKGKEYLYIIYSGKKDVFANGLALHYNGIHKLNAESLNKTAQLFVGEHDFAAFCKAEAKLYLKSTVRKITSFRVVQNGLYTEFYVTGTGFLHNMVRILTGTLIYVAEGKRGEEDILEAFASGNREKAGKTLPPDGLYLNKVFY